MSFVNAKKGTRFDVSQCDVYTLKYFIRKIAICLFNEGYNVCVLHI